MYKRNSNWIKLNRISVCKRGYRVCQRNPLELCKTTSTNLRSSCCWSPQWRGWPTPEQRSPCPPLKRGWWPSCHTQGDQTEATSGDEHAKQEKITYLFDRLSYTCIQINVTLANNKIVIGGGDIHAPSTGTLTLVRQVPVVVSGCLISLTVPPPWINLTQRYRSSGLQVHTVERVDMCDCNSSTTA